MSKEPGFYSSDGDAFWDEINPAEQAALSETIVKECKKVIPTYLFFIVFMVFALIWGIHSVSKSGIMDDPRMILFVTVPVFGVPLFIDTLIRVIRYKKKGQENRFRSAHVKVIDKSKTTSLTSVKCTVTLASTDEYKNTTAIVQIENGLYEKMGIGLTGRFTMIDDEKKTALTSPYWFMSDTDPKYGHLPPVSRTTPQEYVEKKPDVVISGETTSDVRRESILSELIKGYRTDIILSAISTGLFFIAALIAIIGAVMTPEFSRESLSFIMFPSVFFAFAACLVMTPVYNRVIYTKNKINLLYWALMLNCNLFGMLFSMIFPAPARILCVVLIFALNLLFIFLANRDKIKTYQEIKAGRYRAISACVMSKDMRTRFIYPIFIVRLCTCVAQTDSGTSYEINITPSQHKEYFSGMPGTMLILDNMGTDYLFVRV